MFSVPYKKLLIAVFFVVQMMVTPCLPCECGRAIEGNPEHGLSVASQNNTDDTTSRCTLCDLRTKSRQSQRLRTTDTQMRHLTSQVSELVLLDGDLTDRLVDCSDVLPSLSVCELQVFLERWWFDVRDSAGAEHLQAEMEDLRRDLESVRFAPGRADHSETISDLEQRFVGLTRKKKSRKRS